MLTVWAVVFQHLEYKLYAMGIRIVSILQKKKAKPINQLAQDHTASKEHWG